MTHPNGWLLVLDATTNTGRMLNLCYAYDFASEALPDGAPSTRVFYIIPGTQFSNFVVVAEEIGSLVRRVVATPAFAEVTP